MEEVTVNYQFTIGNATFSETIEVESNTWDEMGPDEKNDYLRDEVMSWVEDNLDIIEHEVEEAE